jgi:hypothetical protein
LAEAPKDIAALVEKFDRNLLDYRSSSYNEAQTRQGSDLMRLKACWMASISPPLMPKRTGSAE